jgi:hypothetical protein
MTSRIEIDPGVMLLRKLSEGATVRELWKPIPGLRRMTFEPVSLIGFSRNVMRA